MLALPLHADLHRQSGYRWRPEPALDR
eukprot:COSAG06_NODE_52292_length_306_cov_1.473430_1_plen_26_part_10